MSRQYDTIVIGGGFYGCAIAQHLASASRRVAILEREPDLFRRASYVNQARVHAGYHYPRSLQTAASSITNLSRFRERYADCIDSSFRAIYAIARSGSKVNRRNFERFAQLLNLPLRPAPARIVRHFNPRLIESVYECEEHAFDAVSLKQIMQGQLTQAGVNVVTNANVDGIRPVKNGIEMYFTGENGCAQTVRADWVYNATYANLNSIEGVKRPDGSGLRQQVTEVCLVEPPDAFANIGVTVMDGPFFSLMPFPARGLHSLTHVRYTPHYTWFESGTQDRPDMVLGTGTWSTRFEWMRRDAARYIPVLAETRHRDQLFDVKTTLVDTQSDDARPIAFYRDPDIPGLYSVLGGKIDNIFDILKVIDSTRKNPNEASVS